MNDILVPSLGESITEATVGKWHINIGDTLEQDKLLVELETDKVTIEVNAPVSGVLKEILFPAGSIVKIGDTLGRIEEGKVTPTKTNIKHQTSTLTPSQDKNPPSVKKLLSENNLSPSTIPATGKDNRLTKTDIIKSLATEMTSSRPVTTEQEERVPMSRLRLKIAERLKTAQQTAAILTTFNEVDMSHIIELRSRLQESFQASHGVKLGFMSFFIKASIQALKEIPALNAEIDGTDIVFKHYYDIGVAVSTDRGLVVPIVRNAANLSFGEIEKTIADLGNRAREGKLDIDELMGGTFSITNGGIFGSLMSTPIINPPQCGILGMHAIQNRPVVIDNKIEIRPMMYLALSYDHRLVDGKEAVTFLVRLKQMLEDPERLLLEV